jgi:hypothetical protein
LIQNGTEINHQNSSGYSLLHVCVRQRDILGALLLFFNFADFNIKDGKGRTVEKYVEYKKRHEFKPILERVKKWECLAQGIIHTLMFFSS